MLIIRPEQMKLLNRPFEIAFRKTVTEYLAADFPDRCKELGPEGVKDFIEHGIAAALRHGLEYEKDICEWIGAMAVFGRDLDKEEWVASILEDTTQPVETRVSRLMGWIEAMQGITRGK